MARLKRVSVPGVPEHVIQRGNNRQDCFTSEEDKRAYVHWLKENSRRYKVDVHAWVLMTNHVHLLCTPQVEGAMSKLMQAMGRLYVRYFNDTYNRSGTLWEGRFKSSLIQSNRYLLEVYRYIELNPVRAKMVDDPGEYVWSSYRINAMGVESELMTPHGEYLRLGKNKSERQANYQALFEIHLDLQLLKEIRESVQKGLALGDKRFTNQIETLTQRRVSASKRGRPRKKERKKRL